METLLLYLAGATLAFSMAFGIDLALGNRSIQYLKDVDAPPGKNNGHPKVSVIIPARNEQKNIEQALQSVLRQDYPNREIIVVNDRSTDQTGAILDRMAQGQAGLRVLHVSELPEGWLGKNYALYSGAQQATGDLLLFTDADIVMHPSVLNRAVHFLGAGPFDHITVAPSVDMPGLPLKIFAAAFTLFFALYARPWKAKDPKSRRHIGIGAFNLLRAEVYRAVGTHQTIAMRPDDDMKLGKLIKKHGYRQNVLFAQEMLTVEWYSSLRQLFVGLEKNSFAGVDYQLSAIVAGTLFQLLCYVWPFLAVFLTTGAIQAANVLIVLVLALTCWDNSRFHHTNPWYGLGFPLAVLMFIAILWNSTLTTLRQDGINWRGTHYPLAELKANKI
jgi:glycosyltransferase involved in cell wall biosynthesis